MRVIVIKPFGRKVKGQTLDVTKEIGNILISKGLAEDVNKPKPKRTRKQKSK